MELLESLILMIAPNDTSLFLLLIVLVLYAICKELPYESEAEATAAEE